MRRQIVVVIQDGQVAIAGDDLPDLAELKALIGEPEIDRVLSEFGLDPALNTHLCG